MNKNMYRRLALQNIRNNKNSFFPFVFSVITMCAMFYMLSSIQKQAGENLFFGAETMQQILLIGVYICGIFSLFVIFYTNSFLMKRRTKELGMYSILGMEKKHINKVVFWEMYIIGMAGIAAGLILGILFSKLMFLILVRLLKLKGTFVFEFMPDSVVATILLFAGIFALIMIGNMLRVLCLKPMQLMSSSRMGEREPKAKWALAAVGVLCLAGGYYLALSASNPIEAMGIFFVAVLLVIAGTYLLFISGSIVLLKLLKKNPKFYYQKNHFITVSGMMYRMKQNAVGLANICILSTAVLVVISTTVSLYVGIDNTLRTRYPKDVLTSYIYEKGTGIDPEEFEERYTYDYSLLMPAAQELAEKYQVTIQDEEAYYSYYSLGELKDDCFSFGYSGLDTVTILEAVTMDSYIGEGENSGVSLKENEALYYTIGGRTIEGDILHLGEDLDIHLAEKVSKASVDQEAVTSSCGMVYLVVPDIATLEKIRDAVNATSTDGAYNNIEYHYNFNLSGKKARKEAFCEHIQYQLEATEIAHMETVENIFSNRQEFMGIYGGLFFIGIFIGVLFLLTTVLIIYYKQISEGYDDCDRFAILQKVGMGSGEVQKTITSQILLVFFLPILLAVIHVCFAFDIIRKILLMLNLSDWMLFVKCTIGTTVIFFLVYAVVYRLTARAYYKIVKTK